MDSLPSSAVLPELPVAPRYPCPFLTATDIETYLVPLYKHGWGISRVSAKASTGNTTPAATQLSKRISLPNPDIAGILVKDVTSIIVEQENHHPVWDSQVTQSSIDIHVHTHAALAPVGRQNADDEQVIIRKRPGITYRDIRFAILFERLLRDYVHGGFLDSHFPVTSPQPTDIDAVHNFRTLSTVL